MIDFTKLRYNLFPNRDIGEFCKLNKAKWSDFIAGVQTSDHYVILDGFTEHPGVVMTMGLIANSLKKTYGLESMWVRRNYFNRKQRDILRSYSADKIINIPVLKFPILLLKSLVEAAAILLEIDIDGLPKWKYKGLLIGDLIYDSYLRETGEGTIRKKDFSLYRKIAEALLWHRVYSKLLGKFHIDSVVLGQIVYNQFGILARLALKHGARLHGVRWGNLDTVWIRRYDSAADIAKNAEKISSSLFDNVYKNNREIAIEIAEKYLKTRLAGLVTSEEAQGAYSKRKKYYTKAELSKMLVLDMERPFVFIMGHVFTDVAHYDSWYLFNDHYEWISQTIKHIQNVLDVNWILKEHPFNKDAFFGSRYTIEGIAASIFGDKLPDNVAILPEDVSTRSVLDSADGVVTGRGLIGLEASCHGIKSLLGGESFYSDLGFTFSPITKEEYFSLLSSLFTRQNNQIVDVDKAKAAAFLYFEHAKVKMELIPGMKGFTLKYCSDEETLAYREAKALLSKNPLSTDYGVGRILDYLISGADQLTNSFDIYSSKKMD